MPPRPVMQQGQTLRQWQRKALMEYLRGKREDFLAVATPGAGKTTFALRVAMELFGDGTIDNLTVVTPTEHLKTQWAEAAARVGIDLDAGFRNSDVHAAADFHGAVVTYAQVGVAPAVHRRRTLTRKTLVVLDEIHHAGDSRSWGDGVKAAFEPAVRRLMLTGTPFRSDDNPIPFVTYERGNDGLPRSKADTVYGYSDALHDGVVRPVIFLAYSGETRWRTSAGDELAARLGEPMTQDLIAQAWRTALDPTGDWMPQVLRAADARLQVLRSGGMPDAGGLVIASDQTAARAYAKVLGEITGEKAVVVLSDDQGSSGRIATFAASDERWMVAVRMVSEGVDVPRLAVGVYATSTSTPLFFAQAVGRFVRARRRGETASVFLPSVPVVLDHASRLEEQRDHALDRKPNPDDVGQMWAEEQSLLDEANRADKASGALDEGAFEALESDAHFDHVLFDKQQWGMHAQGGSEAEEEYLGLPGLLEPDQVSALLRERQSRQVKKAPQGAAAPMPVAAHRALAAQRKELNKLVSTYARQKGLPHANVHMDLRRVCGGPDLAAASSEQVSERIDKIRLWLVGRR